ncbi:type VI secretion system protein TssA [Vibrio paucivorans]|uniref:Type VI secretion system ImpA family N-terminal domain-containing protein n=1 Tax=Vibrio paucivorans TaxID=2829489 RepID=A0A9X3HQ09_9VIBR|nr:type VI secretion system ImpA family N-terminal domain-containing protein [Vibrio paucivorans]MCW8332966.1 type VI secretion system ImpA family N-terminal domain-containing protein [Vibrio paucivorans]
MVDTDSLLTPISESEPCGVYLKLDRSAYRGIRNAYNASQSSFRQLVETPDASSDQAIVDSNEANWQSLREITEDALKTKTKDLEILGWYITSQLFTSQPYENLSCSISLIKSYADTWWDDLNPKMPTEKLKSSDEAGQQKEQAEFKIKPLLQLVGESNESTSLYIPLQMLGLVDDITFADYLRAERQGEIASLKEKALGLFSSDTQHTLMALSDSYVNLVEAEATISTKCNEIGVSAISFRFIKQNIADLINAIQFLVGDKFAIWPLDSNYQPKGDEPEAEQPVESVQPQGSAPTAETSSASQPQSTSTAAGSPAPAVTSSVNAVTTNTPIAIGPIASREQAFHEIRKVAEFFKKNEPHSPIAFLLERAIRWGQLSLPELLQEMVGNDSSALNHINLLTGMDNLETAELGTYTAPAVPAMNSTEEVKHQDVESRSNPSSESTETMQNTVNQNSEPSSQDSGNLTDFEW